MMNKKFNKLLGVISLVLAMFVSLFAFGACFSDEGTDESEKGSVSESIGESDSESIGGSESKTPEESQKPTVKIVLSAKTVTVEEYLRWSIRFP